MAGVLDVYICLTSLQCITISTLTNWAIVLLHSLLLLLPRSTMAIQILSSVVVIPSDSGLLSLHRIRHDA